MEKYSSELRAQLMDRETSIRTEIRCPGGGKVITLGFPGLAFDVRGETYIDTDRMRATLTHSSLSACKMLIVLVEREEVPEESWPLLSAITNEQSLRLVHLPIKDYEAPDSIFLKHWSSMAQEIAQALDADGAIALSCHYGAGRSGTMAAAMLMDRGLTATAAVEVVRAEFADSIESAKQMEWLLQREAGDPTPGPQL